MNNLSQFLSLLAEFLVVAVAAYHIGGLFSRVGLPKITGYLITGLVAGPFLLGLIPEEAPRQLLFIDEFSLAFIAFAAGSELYLPELRGRLRSIGLVTAGLVVFTFLLTLTAIFLLANSIPFTAPMETAGRVAVALLVASILVARSPSSAIAIVNEVRAKGPFTQMALGVTVVMDVLVIILFAISSSAADALLTGVSFSIGFVFLLLLEMGIAIAAGIGLYKFLEAILKLNSSQRTKTLLILLTGFAVFLLSNFLRTFTHDTFPFEIFVEPLLVCLVGSFLVNNYSPYRLQFLAILSETGILIYVLFFTLTGASLELELLIETWPIALALFATRFVAVVAGSFVGGTIAGDPIEYNRIKWMAFLTQAGVALGLAREVADEFPRLGADFATLIISVVVINETIGPLFFKRAIKIMGESHARGPAEPFDGVRDALIFGEDGQAAALARQLETHGWQVRLVVPGGEPHAQLKGIEMKIHRIPEVNESSLENVDARHADAIVTLLSDEENYRILSLAYELFGTELLVTRLQKRENAPRFQELNAVIVEPSTALVSLLDHVVRAPSAASIFLGMDDEQDMIDLELRDKSLDGILLRDLPLPLDSVVLSIHRDGHLVVPHGYTQLCLGDQVTITGSPTALEQATLLFDAP